MTFPAFPQPAGLEFPVGGPSPKASTLVQKAISGRVTDQPLWAAPIYEYEVSVSALNANANARGGLGASDYQQFVDFWKLVKFNAPFNRFTISDPNDNKVAGQEFGIGDGVTAQFQLTRSLSNFAEPVLVPVCGPNTPAIGSNAGNFQGSTTIGTSAGNFQGSTAVGASAGYFSTMQVFESSSGPIAQVLAPWSFVNGSAQASGGQITIAPAPANGKLLTWTGAYLWLCRFTDDGLDLSNFMYQLFSLKKLAFETVHL